MSAVAVGSIPSYTGLSEWCLHSQSGITLLSVLGGLAELSEIPLCGVTGGCSLSPSAPRVAGRWRCPL